MLLTLRLRVASNFGDGDCGAGENTRARELPSRRVSSKIRARVCISPAPQSLSPKLETTRSLTNPLNLRPNLVCDHPGEICYNCITVLQVVPISIFYVTR